MDNKIIFIFIGIFFIMLSILRYFYFRRKKYADIIEIELMKNDLVFVDSLLPTWKDSVPKFYDKFRIGDFINLGAGRFANTYYTRKVILKNKRNDELITYARIRKDILGNFEIMFRPRLEELN